jgi:hypothetical protein
MNMKESPLRHLVEVMTRCRTIEDLDDDETAATLNVDSDCLAVAPGAIWAAASVRGWVKLYKLAPRRPGPRHNRKPVLQPHVQPMSASGRIPESGVSLIVTTTANPTPAFLEDEDL